MKYINDESTISLAANGDEEAMERLVNDNMGLVRSAAKRFMGRGTDYEDLVQIGCIGLIKAIRNFDPKQNCVLSTYAVVLIIGEIKRYLRDDGLIKISRTTKQNSAKIASFSADFYQRHQRMPTIKEISQELCLNEEDVIIATESSTAVISLFEKPSEDQKSPEEMIGKDCFEGVYENLSLKQEVEKLDKDQQLLIDLRYKRNLTQTQTAKIMGITQVKVSREEKKIFQRLKKALE